MAVLPNKKTSLKVSGVGLEALKDAMLRLTKLEVLVGFPEDTTEREASGEEPEGITNAALGYIHDRGMPEQNIPARPFMEPGMAEATGPAADLLGRLAKEALKSKGQANVEAGFHRVGLRVQATLRRKINEGIPPPLSEYTLRRRAAKGRKGAKKELERRAQGESASTQFAKPLIDTGQLRNAINYVIRSRKKRK